MAKSTAAVAGAVALVAATAAYYVLDSVLRDEPLSLYGPEIMRWLLVSILAGPVLGAVGAVARRTGVVALVAGLVIPGAAAALMLAHPPGAGAPTVTDEQIVARLVVVAAAAAGAAIVTVRFARARHRRV